MPDFTVGVVGANGFLGSEAIRLLASHPSFGLTQATSAHHGGKRLSEVAPWLPPSVDLTLTTNAEELDVDAALLALPPGEALSIVPGLLSRGIRVVDMGADYRLKAPGLYEDTYARAHTDPEGLGQAAYGLTELNRDAIRAAKLVANPGCYPTATLLALVPLAKKGLLPPHVIVDAKSGTSGAGASPTPSTHHPQAGASVTPYGEGKHRHLPEIREALGRLSSHGEQGSSEITFYPHLVPLVRGILCSIYAPGVPVEHSASWAATLQGEYSQSPFVRVGPVPKLPWTAGSNSCLISVQSSPPSLVLFSTLDNLVKGGAGQAIQNLNVMFGLPETAGLPLGGLGI